MRRRATLLLVATLGLAGCTAAGGAARPAGSEVDPARPCAAVPMSALAHAFGDTFARPTRPEKFDTGLKRCTFVGTRVTVSLAIDVGDAPTLDAELGWKDPGDPLVLTRTVPRLGKDSAFLTEPGPIDDRAASLLVVSDGDEWNLDADGAPQAVLQRQLLALGRTLFAGATRRGA